MIDTSLLTDPDLPHVVARVLAEHGPMTDDELIEALDERGVELGDEPELALDLVSAGGRGLLARLADDRWAAVPALLAGRVFTHRLTDPEVEHDILHVTWTLIRSTFSPSVRSTGGWPTGPRLRR